MKISREEVLRVAELAHLELSAQEVETFRGQLDEILTYIDKLKKLDVSNVEPMAQVLFGTLGHTPKNRTDPYGSAIYTPPDGLGRSVHPELRDDELKPCSTGEELLKQAPNAAGPFFRVPKVIAR